MTKTHARPTWLSFCNPRLLPTSLRVPCGLFNLLNSAPGGRSLGFGARGGGGGSIPRDSARFRAIPGLRKTRPIFFGIASIPSIPFDSARILGKIRRIRGYF